MLIDIIEGAALPLRGHDIDTDRIIPARFLKSVRFEGLEAHLFEDDRLELERRGAIHPFSNPAYRGARVLVVNRNFGCGSSREHAPQALIRWGIAAVVGESFSEIFFGNSLALGLPCLTARGEDVERLMAIAEQTPREPFHVSVADQTVRTAGSTVTVALPPGIQGAFLSGGWDATGMLLERVEEVEAVAERLPYVRGF